MPLFYFDVLTDDAFIPDDEGLWFPSLEGAKRDAAEAVIAIIREAEVDRVSIEVRDDAGNTVGDGSFAQDGYLLTRPDTLIV